MHGGEMVNSTKVNPNSLLTETGKSNLDISKIQQGSGIYTNL